MPTDPGDLLQPPGAGDSGAPDQLFALLYHELRALAEHHLRRGGGGLTLGTTTLVHEAYLNLVDRSHLVFPDRSRFFAYASRAMRGLVLDYARNRRAKKRGRAFEITLVDEPAASPATLESAEEIAALGEALDRLADVDARLTELVDLHFFGGFSFAEIADQRGVSERTIQRDWRKARLLLHGMLGSER